MQPAVLKLCKDIRLVASQRTITFVVFVFFRWLLVVGCSSWDTRLFRRGAFIFSCSILMYSVCKTHNTTRPAELLGSFWYYCATRACCTYKRYRFEGVTLYIIYHWYCGIKFSDDR
ncbi:hypothetical protein BT63DRAFT_270841 [Microthyrium microscopicum]|uniref:Uncharacterized protein n=1 Tax=Microthyrium microscopicum TaxID=703497 RepID=A0A6A6U7H7_9PEZI|nr:hypothetical protein BT63DRAFT_270841 [Microthyrium microscopicum]